MLSKYASMVRARACAILSLLFLLAGCASTPGGDQAKPVFFPAPPDPPRLQYLTRYSSPADVETAGGGLKAFIVGSESLDDHLVRKPYGVTIHEGQILVADTRGQGYGIFDLKRRTTDFVRGSGNGAMKKPINISVDADGTRYVTDTGRNKVMVYDRNNRFLRAYGASNQFKPIDALPVGDRLYVTDLYRHQVQVLDKNTGELLFTFGKAGSGDEEFFQPTNLALGPDNTLYISDTGNFRVQAYTLDGKYIRTYGSIGDSIGHFARPKGVAVDRENHLYIVDAAFENVQILNHDGTPLMFFAEAGDDPGNINLPTDIVIDYDNVDYFRSFAAPGFNIEYVVLVASQFGLNKVSVFGFGKMDGMEYPDAVTAGSGGQDEK